ncbi:MAG: response regulator [Lachnospiraceae bacterium]|nr:response regulator [Lachnospiraceae bacterium]
MRDKVSFMINALAANLKNGGYDVIESDFDIKSVVAHEENTDIMILFAGENITVRQNLLVYLKDIVVEKGKLLILIGEKEEIDAISEYIPPHLFCEVIERPLDMNAFIEKIDNIMNEEQAEKRKKSILLVDDDSSYLQLLHEWLKEDYRVGMAKSGVQAITWLARNNVDLILLDYEMPVTNGLQVYEMLKSEQFSKDIPIMFLTSKSDKDIIMKVMSHKPAGYMLKHITKSQLLSNISKYFLKEEYSKLHYSDGE